METNTKTSNATLDRAYSASSHHKRPDDVEHVVAIADLIGAMTRDEYLELRTAWRVRYAALSAESRQTKPLRKGGNEKAQWRCLDLKSDARRLMAVRAAIREVARRHVAGRLSEVA